MIPKRIFTVWLSEDRKIPPFIQKCIDTHKLEGYEHRLITLDNCYKDSKYMMECITSPHISRKWCKASDYLRMFYLLTEGGIYLDADVEILPGKNFDHLLDNQAFIGKEVSGELTVLGTAVVAAESGHPLIKEWINTVEQQFRGDDDKNYESSMHILNLIGVRYQDQMQLLEPDVFYPYNHFTGETHITPNTLAIHKFARTWTEANLNKYIFNIQNNIPFSFVKRGDGELACMNGEQGGNCDGHPYSEELGNLLKESFQILEMKPEVDIVEFDDQTNYNILLHRTDSALQKTSAFWKAIIDSDRHVTFIGPKRLEDIAKMFNATFIEVPLINSFEKYWDIWRTIPMVEDEIYIFCAGMMSKSLIAHLLDFVPNITCLDAGSAFDPYIGQTRTFQISKEEFDELYKDYLNKPKVYEDNFSIPQEEHPERMYVINHINGVDDMLATILDLGCGSHKTVQEAIGMDIRPVTDKQGDIQELPFGSDNADIIISRHSFEHVLDPVKTMREWIRVLKPLGKMIIVLPDQEFINTMDSFYSHNEHMHAYTRDSFRSFLSMFPELVIEEQSTILPNWSFGTVVRKYPMVSIIIPQLGREEGLKRCLNSINTLNYPKDRIETIVIEGLDTVPTKVATGFAQSSGDYIVYAANDMEFTPLSLKKALTVAGKENKGLVAFNAGPVLPDGGNICEHFIISRSLVQQLGGIFDTRFHHVGVDNLLWRKASNVSQAIRAEEAIIIHNHFSKQGGVYDEIYDKGWKMAERDRELLSRII